MKDKYPEYPTVPAALLVPQEAQPEYLEPSGMTMSDSANVGVQMTVGQIQAGRGRKPALIHHESGLTLDFGDLERESARFANTLLALGIQAGDRVAIRSPNRPEAIIAALGAWRIGAIVVPTPSQTRAFELRFLLLDTDARLLVAFTGPGFLDDVPEAIAGTGIARVVCFGPNELETPYERWSTLMAMASPHHRDRPISSDSLALIWHTGGTTGQPKACYHTHRRFLQAARSIALATGIQAGDRWAAAAPMGHALGFIYYTIYTLIHGATGILIENYHLPQAILTAIRDHRVSTFTAVAATWARMAEAMVDDPRLHDLGDLRRGYAMWQSASSSNVRDLWSARGIALHNNFGSTSFATWVLVPRADLPTASASLGQSAPGYQVEVVGTEAGPISVLPSGSIGRMAVRGPTGLTYWNRPDYQTRDVVDGWTLVDDVIRFDEDGNAHYLGRTDFMISTAGYKVAPVEVEEVLARHPAVREVCVVGAPDALRQQIVVAFVAVQPNHDPGEALRTELQQFAKAHMSPYKYPRRIEFVDALPRDAVGKVQQRRLIEAASGDPRPGGSEWLNVKTTA